MPERFGVRCPICADGLRVEVHVGVCLSWRDALKLRLAGPEARAALLDEIRLKLTEMVLNRTHPENLP